MPNSPQRLVSIRRDGQVYEVELLEFIESGGHGLSIRISPNGEVQITGIGLGRPSIINMYQSRGYWIWTSIKASNIDKLLRILNTVTSNEKDCRCDDVTEILYTVAKLSKNTIIEGFVEKFVKKVPVHGAIKCEKVEIT